MRDPLKRLACAVAGLLLVACSDRPTEPAAPGSASYVYAYADKPLNEAIVKLSALIFPTGLETASGTRWQNVVDKLNAGQVSVAQAQFAELAQWVQSKTSQMEAILTTSQYEGETTEHAAARLVLYMSAYVYGSPDDWEDIPELVGSDIAYGIVLPTQPKTIVTPTGQAGIALEAGSVNVPTLVIVAQDENSANYTACSGPLNTSLCQYPLFYKFDSYPHVKLNKPARFGVCRTTDHELSTEEHNRLRLAHDKPDNSANYAQDTNVPDDQYAADTPIVTEGIEILERVGVSDFLSACPDDELSTPPLLQTASTPLGRAWQVVASLSDAVLARISPRPAYAASGMRRIDQGVGGKGSYFSHFNKVDAKIITSVTVSPSSASVLPGGTVTLTAKDQSGDPIVDRPVTWSITGSGVASIDDAGGATATVTGIEAGSATVTATVGATGYRLSGTATVTVPNPTFDVTSSNFCNSASFGQYGSAARTPSPCALRLTPADTSQAGAAWTNNKHPIGDGFSTTFTFKFSAWSANVCDDIANLQCGADGIAFVIQDATSSSIGTGGGDIGYAGIPRSVAVEFDTWQNTDYGDSSSNQVSIHTKGVAGNSASQSAAIATKELSGNLNDGVVHTVRINYVPGTMTVVLDGAQVLTASITLTNIGGSSILDSDRSAWVGFTSGTGAAYAKHDITSWSFTPNAGSATILTAGP